MDSWSSEDDEFLVQTVLNTIRTGGTQLEAFQVAAQQLNRTPAACGFRWNGRLRSIYRKELDKAKVNRRKRSVQTRQQHTRPVRMSSLIAIKEAIRVLQVFDQEYQALLERVQTMTAERDFLQERVANLEHNVKHKERQTPRTPDNIQEDVKQLEEILLRANTLLKEQK